MFKRRAIEPMEQPPGDVTGWKIVAELAGGRVYTLNTSVYAVDANVEEMLRVCDAVVDGLNRAGFPSTATVIREQQESRG